MEVTGTLKVVEATNRVSDKFQKRDFVVTIEENTPYPQHIPMQVKQDKCSLLDSIPVGSKVRVQFNMQGKEWNGPQGTKYFLTLDAWRIEKV